MNLNNPQDRDRLSGAMEADYRKLEPYRAVMLALVEEYAGSFYGRTDPKLETIMNLMMEAVESYTMSLVANRPRVTVDTYNEGRKFFAEHFAIAINNMIQEIRLDEVLRRWVLDAFFMLGVIKVHLADVGEVELWSGQYLDPGTPTASNVPLDDFCYDMSAKRWDKIAYSADGYQLSLDYLKGNQFDQSYVKELTSAWQSSGGEERLEELSRGGYTDKNSVRPMVDVMDVWIPDENRIYTFAMKSRSRFSIWLGPLAVEKWDGPELGPHELLSFAEVPENIMSASPASQLISLVKIINNLLRKQSRKAEGQKDVHTYTPAGQTSAKSIQRAADNEWVPVQDQSEIGTHKIGGADPANQVFCESALNQYNRMAGNPQARLGLGPQAATLGQEELVRGAATEKVANMQAMVSNATRKLVRNLAYMLWTDVVKRIPGRMPIPGAEGESIDSTWTPEWREGDFFDYNLDIDVQSMPYRSAEGKVQTINELLTKIYLPQAQSLGQQGGEIDFETLTKYYAELLHLPRLKDIVRFSSPVAVNGAEPPRGGKPPETTRNYVRRSVASGGTPQSQSIQAQQAWASMGSQAKA